MCASHGIDTVLGDDAWTSPVRTPPLYPDAVTVVPEVGWRDLVHRVDVSPGCSVKDSFASLDLTRDGWTVIVEAQWIIRRAGPQVAPVSGPPWTPVRHADELERWERAWAGGGQPTGRFRPSLLDQDIVVLAEHDGDRIVAGAVLNRAAGVVGISNVFGPPGSGSDVWSRCVHAALTSFPGSVLVGYEAGDDLERARRHGFEAIGPLRVWARPDAAGVNT